VKPGLAEAEVEAEFAHEFIRGRAGCLLPIIAPANACVLHYVENSASAAPANAFAGCGGVLRQLQPT
jgi:Xaa-Pro aminopeptidase